MRKPGLLVDALRVTPKESAEPRSQSRVHGSGVFPFHTDTAHWQVPGRYIIFGCADPGSGGRKTLLLDWYHLNISDEQLQSIYRSPFRVLNGRQSFFATICTRESQYVRFDMNCMSPTNSASKEVKSLLLANVESTANVACEWTAGQVLVLDNWRILHARSMADRDDCDRELLRVIVQ